MATAAEEFAKIGLEPALLVAYIVFINETVGAICVMLGLFTRFFAASIAIELAVHQLCSLLTTARLGSSTAGNIVLLWGLIFFAIALRGGGPYSLDRKIGREL